METKMSLDLADKVLHCIDDDEVVRFMQQFVQVNSVNPNLDNAPGEQEAAAFLADACVRAGLQGSTPEVLPGRPNFYGVLPGESDEIGLAFFGHIDTVALMGMKDPFSGEIVDGHIWGRGSVDQKGGVAAAVQALLALARSGIRFKKSIAVWGVMDEESEHRGAHAIVNSGFRADFAISTEPSDRLLLLGHKGTTPLRIEVQGVPAHALNPHLGVNAINQAYKVVRELNQFRFKKFIIPELNQEVEGTLNIGVISGGTAYNIVADHCSLYLDRRTVPGETRSSCLQEIQEILDRLAQDDPTFKARVEVARPDWHWEPVKERGLNPVYTPASAPVAQAVQSAFSRLNGTPVPLTFAAGYTDMDFFVNSLGIPTVDYGPGEAHHCHTVTEALRIDQLLETTRVYALAAVQLLA